MKIDPVKVERVTVGELRTNTWLIEGLAENAPDGTGSGDAGPASEDAPLIIIDPGADPDRILDAVAGRPVAGVLLTHGHFDHTGAADEVADETSSYLYMSAPELAISPQMIADIEERYGIEVPKPRIDFQINDGDVLDLAGLRVEVMLTPGHTPGSVGYLISAPGSDQKHYFSGDTLFARDVGRTDLLGGNQADMERSIERIARELDPATKVYPGHGPSTTIERESLANSWWPTG